ncbi:MAG TPA: hypothetical protein VN363_00925 [Anaerolineales bacterium]|nr:hypothetical protein [Anaerolineales bacterium]
MNSLQISNERLDVSKAAASLWIANAASTLTGLDAGVDPGYNRFGSIGGEFCIDAPCCMPEAVAYKYVILSSVFLVHTLTQVGFQKGLCTILTVIYNRTVRRTTKTILYRAYFSKWDV